jgi:type IX secretion system PorP/SprF family membrane protein
MKFILNIKKGLGILVLVILANTAFAQQDPMYTQYFFNSQTINPAYAGTWETLGFTTLVRQQWAGWTGAPRTFTLSMQTPTNNEKVALGLNIISDVVYKEKRLGLWGDYSYKVRLSEKTNIRMGFKAGFINYTNNTTDYDLVNSNDPMFQMDLNYKFLYNFGFGMFLHNPGYYLGFSIPKVIHNILKGDDPGNFSVEADFRHYYMEGGLIMSLNEDVKFKPAFMAKAVAGAPVQLDVSANFIFGDRLSLGAMYRTIHDAGVIAQWMFDNNLRLGYAFDFSVSSMQNHHFGNHEVMVSYELGNKRASRRTY